MPPKTAAVASTPGNRKIMRRIVKEIERMKASTNPNFVLIPPDESNIRHFQVIIFGPPDTPYEGGKFLLDVTIPQNYPLPQHDGRPKFKFLTKIYHPNIGVGGQICLDILYGNYSPQSSLESLIVSLVSMFMDPNTSSPMNSESARLFDNDRPAFDAKVKDWIKKHGYKGDIPTITTPVTVDTETEAGPTSTEDSQQNNMQPAAASASIS